MAKHPTPSLHLVLNSHEDTQGQRALIDQIVQTIADAISEQRLLPGARLTEESLSRHFNAPKALVEQSLLRLSNDRLVTLRSPKGAYVSVRGMEDIEQALAVRRMIECEIVRQLSTLLSPQHALNLRRAATSNKNSNDKISNQHTSCDQFHIELARSLGNEVLVKVLIDLIDRSEGPRNEAQPQTRAHCNADEHMRIVEALENGNGMMATKLMHRHLKTLERGLYASTHRVDISEALKKSD